MTNQQQPQQPGPFNQPQWGAPQPPRKMSVGKKIAIGIAAGFGGLFMLGACGAILSNSETGSNTSKPAAAATETVTATPAPAEKADDKPADKPKPTKTADLGDDTSYLLALDISGMDTFEGRSNKQLVEMGKKACQLRRDGKDDGATALALKEQYGGNVFAMSFLIGVAQSSYCPDLT